MEKGRLPVVITLWVLFAVYVLFIIYVSTAFLPPELPEEEEDDDDPDIPKPPPDPNGTGTGSGGSSGPVAKPAKPEEPPLVLKPVYYFRDRIPNFDLYSNVGLYLMFGVLAFLALATVPKFDWKSIFLIAVLMGVILSIFLEIFQSNTAYRIGDPNDVIYNVLGSLLGAAALYLFFINKERLDKKKEMMEKV